MQQNIFPVFDQMIQRHQKEAMLKQKSVCFWMTGLSGSGKSTLALALEKSLFEHGYLTQVLDGDNIRSGINKNLSFSEADRKENIRRIAEINKLFINCGIITINCFVSPTREIRQMAKEIIGPADFKEIYVKSSLETCEKRDVKGLYKKARAGEIKNFTGIDQTFEEPTNPDLIIDTENRNFEECINIFLNFVWPLIQYNE